MDWVGHRRSLKGERLFLSLCHIEDMYYQFDDNCYFHHKWIQNFDQYVLIIICVNGVFLLYLVWWSMYLFKTHFLIDNLDGSFIVVKNPQEFGEFLYTINPFPDNIFWLNDFDFGGSVDVVFFNIGFSIFIKSQSWLFQGL